jgi:hypothetical protein
MPTWTHVKRAPTIGLLVLCLGTAGCGGGTGVAETGGNPGPVGDAVTGQVLEDCLLPAMTGSQDLARVLQSVIQGLGSTVGFSIPTGGVVDSPDDLLIQWEYDPDLDLVLDAQGELTFVDAAFMPVQPFAQTHIDALNTTGIDALGAALQSVTDGTSMRVSWNGPPGGQLLAALVEVAFAGGQPGNSAGNTQFVDLPCGVTLSWDTVALASLAATFPTGVFQLVIDAGSEHVEGTLTANGSSVAMLVVRRGGGGDETWDFDLGTGTATPR